MQRVSYLIGLSMISCLSVMAQEPIRVLIMTGCDYPGHHWRETTPEVRRALEEDSRFQVFVCEDPEIMATPMHERYDVLIFHYCNWEQPMPRQAVLDGLADSVRQGLGVVALHFACGAFLEWPEFENILGRVWDREKTHDPYGPFTVHIANPDHPITRGMTDFETTDELYFCLKGSPEIEVLFTAHSKVTDQDEAMGFALQYGKGRVFHTPLGHDVQAFSTPGVRDLLRRACQWAATGDVTAEPAKSPSDTNK
ncbi:MAG TPA: ThuA domain-containing protein [bacterium]|nr:ThuA domain-containing protein [bacterium]HPO07339.1 ThuA domain-containing protein [bacterium]HQO35872.1 ThuA domain-containing protein [bacterium]HQP97342.1 ThuA domain-containing protein [bacterium]